MKFALSLGFSGAYIRGAYTLSEICVSDQKGLYSEGLYSEGLTFGILRYLENLNEDTFCDGNVDLLS